MDTLIFILEYTAATITTNIEDDVVCPGKELIITCTSDSTFQQRWTVMNDGGTILAHHLFTSGSQLGAYGSLDYHFTLISTANNRFISTFSTVATSALNDATVECADSSSPDVTTIKIQGGLLTICVVNF